VAIGRASGGTPAKPGFCGSPKKMRSNAIEKKFPVSVIARQGKHDNLRTSVNYSLRTLDTAFPFCYA
jgi:hypothetical protein